MLKKLLFLLFCSIIIAKPITIEIGKEVATNFVNHQLNYNVQSNEIIFSQAIKDNDIPIIYVYNIIPTGFILIAANNSTKPILSYSLKNNFKYDFEDTNISYIINLYKNEISYNSQPHHNAHNQWAIYLTNNSKYLNFKSNRAIDPLISAEFNQGCDWNEACPYDSNGPCGNVLVGCGAVAISQILHYWKYPINGVGSNSYDYSTYGILSANFENTTYDYNNMANTVWSEASQLLLFHTGVAIEMEYGPYVSWSYMWGGHPSIQYAIPNFFNFSTDITLIHDYQYSNNDFMGLLKNELDNGRPMIYRGVDSNAGGHFWNIDGYDNNDLFHCNWGWGGNANGFWSLTSLEPGSSDYTNQQSALINIIPFHEYGDLNSDEQINILDIVIIVNIILNNGLYYPLADMDGNFGINILDIIILIDSILE